MDRFLNSVCVSTFLWCVGRISTLVGEYWCCCPEFVWTKMPELLLLVDPCQYLSVLLGSLFSSV